MSICVIAETGSGNLLWSNDANDCDFLLVEATETIFSQSEIFDILVAVVALYGLAFIFSMVRKQMING